jgi:hypothetical protein
MHLLASVIVDLDYVFADGDAHNGFVPFGNGYRSWLGWDRGLRFVLPFSGSRFDCAASLELGGRLVACSVLGALWRLWRRSSNCCLISSI